MTYFEELDDKFSETIEEIIENDDYDQEYSHIMADGCLILLLETLGFEKTVKAWDSVPKWYA